MTPIVSFVLAMIFLVTTRFWVYRNIIAKIPEVRFTKEDSGKVFIIEEILDESSVHIITCRSIDKNRPNVFIEENNEKIKISKKNAFINVEVGAIFRVICDNEMVNIRFFKNGEAVFTGLPFYCPPKVVYPSK